jgi:holo-[acyl-carrier protein] synthase
MVVGIGVDVFSVRRMARELSKDGVGLRESLFTPGEIAYCEGKRSPAPHYAARFAAKEALYKALGDGQPPGGGASWRDAEVRNDASGRSRLVLHGALKDAASGVRADRIFLSLSHTREWAVATVVLESSEARPEERRD